MNFDELIDYLRNKYETSDARNIFEHVAIQVNLEGDAKGTFYLEIAERKISIEPYDYFDKDGLITTTSQCIYDILENKLSIPDALKSGLLKVEGDMNKLKLYYSISFH